MRAHAEVVGRPLKKPHKKINAENNISLGDRGLVHNVNFAPVALPLAA